MGGKWKRKEERKKNMQELFGRRVDMQLSYDFT